MTALAAEGHDDVHEEEGQPADDERRHDDRHRPRSLPLLRQRYLQLRFKVTNLLIKSIIHLAILRD